MFCNCTIQILTTNAHLASFWSITATYLFVKMHCCNLFVHGNVVVLAVATLNDGMDRGFAAQRMICSGVPLDEPYLQYCLSTLESGERKKLKEGKIPVSESCYLMGTADPTGVLNNDEVCVILYVKVLFSRQLLPIFAPWGCPVWLSNLALHVSFILLLHFLLSRSEHSIIQYVTSRNNL